MKKYFLIQLKRLLRIFPSVLLVAALLFGCVFVAYRAINNMNDDTEKTTRFQVGIVGTAGDSYLTLGLKALESLDSSRFAVELVEMQEDGAENAMRRGDISAFIVIPDGFLDAALRGEIMPLKFVCTSGSLTLVSMFKDELTRIIEVLLIESQKGIYGSENAMQSQGLNSSQVVYDISIEYAEFVFTRSNMYRASRLETFNGLGLDGYLISGLCILLFMLICLTFAPTMIRRDQALSRMLCAHRRSIFMQVFCDYIVYFLGLFCVAGIVLLCTVAMSEYKITMFVVMQGLAILFSLGAMSFLMYEIASDLVSGVLLQFFVVLALCFISGCLYPITFFPDAVQKLSCFLPTGLARMQLADMIRNTSSFGTTAALLGYGCIFFSGSVLVRRIKVAGVRG